MKASTVLGLFVAYAATASAVPLKQRNHQVEITFIGAADAHSLKHPLLTGPLFFTGKFSLCYAAGLKQF